jgi:hypothetical protein
MEDDEYVLVRGFDLLFSNASWAQLQVIADELGGKSSFDFLEQRATYMFEQPRYVEIDDLQFVHDAANEVGHHMAALHGCEYEVSELYIRAMPDALEPVGHTVNITSIKLPTTDN